MHFDQNNRFLCNKRLFFYLYLLFSSMVKTLFVPYTVSIVLFFFKVIY